MSRRPTATVDKDKTKDQLLAELEELRARNAELEQRDIGAVWQEDDLCENEVMARLLLEQKLYGVWVNVGGRIAYINEIGARILGASNPAEVMGKSVLDDIIHPDYRDTVRDRIRAMGGVGSAAPLVEEKYRRVDGGAVDVDVWAISFIYRGESAILVVFKDITERKQAEEALRLTQFALDNFPDSAIWITLEGEIVYVNQATCKSVGYSREELLSMHIWDIDPDYTRDRFQGLWRESYRQGYAVKFESKHVARDGRAFPVEVTSCYTKYGDKEYLITFDRDITVRKQAEEALRESEGKFRVLAETSPAAIFLYQGEKYVYVNPMAEVLTGYSRDELLAGDAWEWIHPEFRELVKDRARKRQRGEAVPGRYEVKYRSKDGKEGWVDFVAGLIVYGGKPAGLAMAFDVTERKRAEEGLKYAEEFNRSTLDSLPMNVVVLDESGTIIFANRQWMRFGRDNDVYPIRSIDVGANYFEVCRQADGNHSEGAPAALEGMQSVLSGDKDFFEMEYPCHSPGEKRWFTMRVSRIKTNKFRGIIVIHTDITLRKLFEEALADEKARAELYLDLMGHDINNMHQIALGYLELARDKGPMAGQSEFLDKPIEVLQRGAQLIQNVGKLRKLKDGVFQTREVDVCKVLGNVRREFGAIPHKDISLNTNGHEHCVIRANELLHDVFANLVSNAIKHTGDCADIILDMDVLEVNGSKYCRVMVEDNGPGIPDDFKGKIFNRMLRGTTQAKGMGLGLYLVKSLVDSYHGKVWVEDRVKGDHTKGARFVVMLPAF